jgi:hypothetical protein
MLERNWAQMGHVVGNARGFFSRPVTKLLILKIGKESSSFLQLPLPFSCSGNTMEKKVNADGIGRVVKEGFSRWSQPQTLAFHPSSTLREKLPPCCHSLSGSLILDSPTLQIFAVTSRHGILNLQCLCPVKPMLSS